MAKKLNCKHFIRRPGIGCMLAASTGAQWLNPQHRAPRENTEHDKRLHKGVFELVKLNPGIRQGLVGFKWFKVPKCPHVLLSRPLNCTSCCSPAPIWTYSELHHLVFSTEFMWNLDTEFPLDPEKTTLKTLESQSAWKQGYLSEVTPTWGIF